MPDRSGVRSEAEDRRAAQDEILVDALAGGMSYEQAGKKANVVGRTVARRMAEPEFAQRVSQRRGARVAELTGELTTLGTSALKVIKDTMEEGRPTDRLRAAQLVLSWLVRYRRESELEARLAEMEHRLDGTAHTTLESEVEL